MGNDYWSEENLRKMYADLPAYLITSQMVSDIRGRLNSAIVHLQLMQQEIANPDERFFQESHEQIIERVINYLNVINNIMNAALDSENPTSKEN